MITGGLIGDIIPHGSHANVLDFGDLLITPGFVDLQSDSVEKEIEPRPGAIFLVYTSLFDLDRKLAMVGIPGIPEFRGQHM